MRDDHYDVNSARLLTESTDSILVIDAAHGTGTAGPTGRGTAENMEMSRKVILTPVFRGRLQDVDSRND